MIALRPMWYRPAPSARRVGAVLLLAVAALGVATAPARGELIWADEFDGTFLDPANWAYMYGDGCQYGVCGWGNNELQWYTARPENIYVADGMLHIIAREDYWNGHQYTSARIRTKDRADFLYGRLEARIRLPEGEGLWPAFWLLPTDSPYGGWARSGEIDIMEAIDVPFEAHGTLIYGENWPDQVYNGSSHATGDNLADGFHVYALEWEPDEMRWYLDGVHYHTVTSSTWWSAAAPGNPRAPFDTPFHFLLNVAVGGDWPGPPDGSTEFPQEMTVDYVRVYALCPTCPFHGAPLDIPGRVEAEDFDNGGEGVAYHDADSGNNGGQLRTDEDVDIQIASHGGHNVGWIEPGEWLEYTILVRAAGYYDVVAAVAAASAGGTFSLYLDGAPLGPDFSVPATGGWQEWTSLQASVELPAGEYRLRFENSAVPVGYNLSYFDFFYAADTDHDGAMTFADVLPVMFCMTGPDADPVNPACQGAFLEGGDIDGDTDIDLLDTAYFQTAFTE
jgi:beta-glucanase (GH16 family)